LKLRFFARDPPPVSGVKSGRDLDPLPYKLQKISKVKQFFEFCEIFCIYFKPFFGIVFKRGILPY